MRQVAARQFGILRLLDLESVGIDASRRCRLCATGELERAYQAVYRLGGVPRSWEGTLLTYCWSQNPSGYASHRSAARLWGVSGFNDRAFDVIVGRHVRHPRLGDHFRLHESQSVIARDTTTCRGVPVTSPARTVVDLAAVASEERVEFLVESFQRMQLCDIDDIQEAVDRLAAAGQRGARKLRAVMARQGRGERNIDSQTNIRMRNLLTNAGFEEPEAEYPVEVATGWIYPDLVYPRHWIVIECVSVAFHLRGPSYAKDNARRNALMMAGWMVLEFTWQQVYEDSEATLAIVSAALKSRTRGLKLGEA